MVACPKKEWILDKAVLEWARCRPCEGCGLPAPSDAHHLKTQGSGGDDVKTNVLSLCRACHQRVHEWGLRRWWKAYGPRIRRQRATAAEPQPKLPWTVLEPLIVV